MVLHERTTTRLGHNQGRSPPKMAWGLSRANAHSALQRASLEPNKRHPHRALIERLPDSTAPRVKDQQALGNHPFPQAPISCAVIRPMPLATTFPLSIQGQVRQTAW